MNQNIPPLSRPEIASGVNRLIEIILQSYGLPVTPQILPGIDPPAEEAPPPEPTKRRRRSFEEMSEDIARVLTRERQSREEILAKLGPDYEGYRPAAVGRVLAVMAAAGTVLHPHRALWCLPAPAAEKVHSNGGGDHDE